MRWAAAAAWLVLALGLKAEPESDLRQAVEQLSRTTFAWETTAPQRFNGETTEPRINPNAPVEVRGRFDPNGFTEITVVSSRELQAPVSAVLRAGDVVGLTPSGWMHRTQIRQTAGADREVEFGGRKVRLSRVLGAVLQVTARRPLAEEMLDLLGDLKSFRSEQGLVMADLREQAVEKLWGDAQAKRAPEIQGTVIFRLSEAGVTEYHVVIAIGFPNSRTKKTAWQMKQWSTRITGIGSTTVEPPAAAVKALED